MTARLALFATAMLFLAYESHFSPEFFATTVEGSLADIFGGMEQVIAADNQAIALERAAAAESAALPENAAHGNPVILAGWSATTEDRNF